MLHSYRSHASPTRRRPTPARRRRFASHLECLEGRVLLAYTIDSFGGVISPGFDVTRGRVAINSAAEVAATGQSGNMLEAYFLNNNGQTTWLPPLQGGTSSSAMAVNNSKEVAGYSTGVVPGGFGGSTVNEAVLYNTQGQPTDIGNLGGTSQATGLNDSGQVVGDSTTGTAFNSPTHAFLYNKSGPPIDLGTLGGSDSYATAINDSGQIVGYSATSTSSNSPTHAFLLSGNGPLKSSDDLGVPAGYTNSYATAINGKGQIAGYATKSITGPYGIPETVTEPFLYSNGQWIDLGNLGGTDAAATGINDSGEVVGYSATGPNATLGGLWAGHAFLYTSSGASRISTS